MAGSPMPRRNLLTGLLALVGWRGAQAASPVPFPPVPKWQPSLEMKDGNVLAQYNHPALNVVLSASIQTHWQKTETRHLDGLATAEVLIAPAGQNKFDDFGRKALLGRCYMFMDAQEPVEIRIVRATA
jgi:hypothetical protein